MSPDAEADDETLRDAEALARVLSGEVSETPLTPTLARLDARRSDVDAEVDLERVRQRVLRRARLRRVRLLVPASLALAAALAITIGVARPRPRAIPRPEPDIALLEAQVRAATERGLRTDLDVEAWRYRRRLFASIERRYER